MKIISIDFDSMLIGLNFICSENNSFALFGRKQSLLLAFPSCELKINISFVFSKLVNFGNVLSRTKFSIIFFLVSFLEMHLSSIF